MLVKVVPVLALALVALGCGEVKQQRPPRIADEVPGESDIEEDKPAPVPEPAAAEPEETEADKRTKCCKECVAGVAEDKSGDPPGGLSCDKLMPSVGAGCMMFFEKNPMTGKEAQACVDEPAKSPAAPPGG